MSTLSGAIANKLMTNTWLDDKISPKYTTFPFLTFSITWKLTSGSYTTTKLCTYKAMTINIDDRIVYGITNCTHSAGIINPSSSVTSHGILAAWGDVLSKFYLPIINGTPTIEQILEVAEFPITKVQEYLGNLPIGTYTLSQIQSAISLNGTIDVINRVEISDIEKYFYKVSNSGVEYGGNKINYDGTPPSEITSYISGEANSSKRVITYKDYNNIFTGLSGGSLRGVREDWDDFNEVTYYAVIGNVYTTYYGPDHGSNVNALTTGGVDLTENSTPIIIPPTITGLDHWNQNAGADAYNTSPYLSLNVGGSNRHMTIGSGSSTSSIYELNARDIAWNYVSNKATHKYYAPGSSGGYGFFGKCERNDNDAMSATLGVSVKANIKMEKDTKIYPGDIFGRQPYITPSILQDLSFDICKVSYLPYNLATQYYKHPTIDRSITSSDGLDSKTIGGTSYAVVPVIYIPSTIAMYSVTGSCNVTLTTTTTYPTVNISFTSNRQFYIYKYAYGNLSSVSGNNATQRVLYNEIFDMSAFLNQLNSTSDFTGTMNYTQKNSGGQTISYTHKFTPKVTFTASSDSSGNLLLTANAQNYSSGSLYNGYIPTATTIGTSEVRFNSVDINGFLIGVVSSYERTTNTSFAVWTGTGNGTSSASLTNVIGDFDYE